MALIKCTECGCEILEKAGNCPECGAPVAVIAKWEMPQKPKAPVSVKYNRDTDTFSGTLPLIEELAKRAVQDYGWKLNPLNATIGIITFQTGMSCDLWSGISLNIEETDPFTFRVKVIETWKQSVLGSQEFAKNIATEVQSQVAKVIGKMKQLVD